MRIPARFAIAVLLAAFGASIGLQAQGAAAAPAPTPGWFQASMSAQSVYDTNVRQDNAAPQAGWEENLNAVLQAQHQTSSSSISLTYDPYLQWFASLPGLNSFNQIAAVRALYQLSPRWILGGHASGGYLQELPLHVVAGLQPLLAAPAAVAPRTREATGEAAVNLSFAATTRLTLSGSGEFQAQRFPGAGASSGLSAVRGSEGEAAATWAWSRRTQIGVRALAQNFGVGNASHLAAESLMLTVSRSLSPLTQVQLYGGPEYSQVHDTFTLNLPGGGVPIALTDRVYRVRTYPRFGAEVSHQDAGHPWSAQLQRQINNGGGALPFPVALTQAQFQCGPRLRPGWRLQFGANVAQMSALAAGNLASRVRMAAVSVTLTRRLSRELSLGLDYSYLAQRASGLIPLTPAVNRSLGGVRLDWVWPGSLESNY
ncbi:MAG TPA: hypothetical protein VN690_14060 [Terriglobales bacterium]|nr:hypothetical protein [Terriglobales bacterium]